jgi:phosphoketolase
MASASVEAKRKSGDGIKPAAAGPLSAVELRKMHAYWRAANYLSVGQIYLMGNPLLKEPLKLEHVKPRLLGHWGTTSGQNFLYVHLNRVIKEYDLNMLYISGPGHGGPALVANAYLEGTYSEVYPNIGQDEAGLKRLFTQFSFPGGIPSHVAPETPGSMHEGGGSWRCSASTSARGGWRAICSRAAYLKQALRDKLIEHKHYVCKHGDDMPEIAGRRWGAGQQAGPGATSTEGDNV